MIRISLVIPTFNEAQNIKPLVEEIDGLIDKENIDLEYIFVDDNSPDGTGQVAESLKGQYPVKVIHRSGKLGLGSAVREGFKLSDREYLGVMDADLSHDPSILNELIKSLSENDIAMGSRFAEGSTVEKWDIVRKSISQAGVYFAGLITGVKDPLSGYFLFRREVIDGVELTTKGYKILLEILVKGSYKKIKQIPFTFRMRQFSTSKLNAEEFILFFGQLVKYGLAKLLPSGKSGENKTILDLHFVALLAALFGFFRLTHQSLWLDESISTVWAASKPLGWIWQNVPKYDLHPPLYYSMLHFWQLIFGNSALAIRSLSVLFFVGSSVLMYYFARMIFKSRPAAFLTAVIFLTNPFAVLYAQETRAYSLLIFLVLLQSVAFYRITYENKSGFWSLAAYWLASLVMIYTNILSLFALFAHFIIVLAKRDRFLAKKFFALYAVLAVCFLPALKLIRNANSYDFSYFSSERYNIFMKAVVVFSGFIGGRINILNGKFHHYGLLAASLAAYGAIGAYAAAKLKKINSFLLWLFILSFGLILIAAEIKFPIPDPKYFFISFPIFLLLVGNVFFLLEKRMRYAAFAMVMIFNAVFLYNYYFVKNYERENWRSAVAQVENDYLSASTESSEKVNAIAVMPFSDIYTPWQYYQKGIVPAVAAFSDGSSSSSVSRVLGPKVSSSTIVYLSRFLSDLYDPQETVKDYLEARGFKKDKVIEDTKVEFWRYELK